MDIDLYTSVSILQILEVSLSSGLTCELVACEIGVMRRKASVASKG